MSDVKDLTSQMAKELALGIKDNVEDIAAAFKKMAVINPERKRVVPVETPAAETLEITEVLKVAATEKPAEFDTRSADAQRKQALYEGLLQKSMEEQKKRKSKKRVELENQISLFGNPAA